MNNREVKHLWWGLMKFRCATRSFIRFHFLKLRFSEAVVYILICKVGVGIMYLRLPLWLIFNISAFKMLFVSRGCQSWMIFYLSSTFFCRRYFIFSKKFWLVKTQKNPKDNSNFKDMLFWLSSKIYLHFVFSHKTQATTKRNQN